VNYVLKDRRASELSEATQPFKTLAENIHPVTHSIVLFTDESIFTPAIQKNPCIA